MAAPEPSHSVESLLNASIAFLRRYPPFDEMEEDALRFLAAQLSLGYYPSGRVILAPDVGVPPHFYIVQRGVVQLQPAEGYHVSGGDVLTLGPGECFSVYSLMEKRAVGSPYTAAADTFCYQVPAPVFYALLHRSPRFQEFSTHYLRALLQDSRRLIQMHSASAAAEQQAMNRTLRALVKRAPIACRVESSLEGALGLMDQARVGSVVIVDDHERPVGIFTRHDVVGRVALARRALTDTIGTVMTSGPVTLPAEASVYDAALLIAARGIRHVPITDQGRLIGVVTERDLFAIQQVSVRGINRVIAQAQDADALVQAGRDVQRLARTLHTQGVSAEQLTQLITTLNDALTQRVIAVVQSAHNLNDIRWCWLTFGSEGRQEQTVSTDQDNGLVFAVADGTPDESIEAIRARLLAFGAAVNALLDRCGFPLCTGGIMAGNAQCCLSEGEWCERFQQWVNNTDPEALLRSVIFFDFRALAGDVTFGDSLREFLNRNVKNNARFLRQLAQYAIETRPPLGLISDFVTESDAASSGFIDLKKSVARLFVDAARVWSLAAGIPHTHTAARLRGAGTVAGLNDAELASAIDAFFFIQQLRLRSQLSGAADAERTGKAGQRNQANRIVPAMLNEIDRRILKESLRQARRLQTLLAMQYQL